MRVKYFSSIILFVWCFLGLLNAQETTSGLVNFEVRLTRTPEKTVLLIKGAHSSLPKKGVRIISVKKLSGCEIERGQLVDVRRVEVKNSAIDCRLNFQNTDLTPGIYFASVKKELDSEKLDECFRQAIFMSGSLSEVERYYSHQSNEVYQLAIGVMNLSDSLKNFWNTASATDPKTVDPEMNLNALIADLRQLQQLENKTQETIQESVHMDSFGLISNMLSEDAGVINNLLKNTPLDKKPLRPGEGDWTLPFSSINNEKATRFFATELLLKTSLEIKLIVSDLRSLPDEANPEPKITRTRANIDLIRELLKEYPQSYPGIITLEKIRTLVDAMALADSLMVAFENEMKKGNQVTWNEAKETLHNKIESFLPQ